jgi:hypothetical protein
MTMGARTGSAGVAPAVSFMRCLGSSGRAPAARGLTLLNEAKSLPRPITPKTFATRDHHRGLYSQCVIY